MNRSVTIAFIVFVTLAIAAKVSQTHALFGFGKTSDNTMTSFVSAHSVDQASITLAQNAITMLQGDHVINTAQPTHQASTLIQYNIIQAVQSSDDRNQTLNNHITHLKQSLNSYQSQSNQYQSQSTQIQSKLSECTAAKKIADSNVIKAINSDDTNNIEILIDRSVEMGECETQQRIRSNALTLMMQRNSNITSLLTKKISILEQYKAQIIQYPEVIVDPNLIKELSQIQNQL